ncbi:type II secretion system protein [Candidatus Saccharibacteria bacterium]|nr:type II secretion system protein [Candidatus Saccharibacteria bacterium]
MLRRQGGFTLMEVMITLAVSGAMLMITVALFSGQQRESQFNQSMRDIESKLQDVINDTATGYFPESTLSCSANANIPIISSSGPGSEQGTNSACVFLGKAIHFKDNAMDIYSIIGSSSLSNTTFQSANPTLVSEIKETKEYIWGINLYQIWWGDNIASHLDDGRLVVVSSSPNGTGYSASGSSLNSGVQQINTYSSGTVAGTGIDQNSPLPTMDSAIKNASLGWPANGTITLCFQDDQLGQSGRQYGGILLSGGNYGIYARLLTDTDPVGCN